MRGKEPESNQKSSAKGTTRHRGWINHQRWGRQGVNATTSVASKMIPNERHAERNTSVTDGRSQGTERTKPKPKPAKDH